MEDEALVYVSSLLPLLLPAALAALIDEDQDGYARNAQSPLTKDCDDTNASVSPARQEVVGDGLDQDCDHHDAARVIMQIATFDPEAWSAEGVETPQEGDQIHLGPGQQATLPLSIMNPKGQLHASVNVDAAAGESCSLGLLVGPAGGIPVAVWKPLGGAGSRVLSFPEVAPPSRVLSGVRLQCAAGSSVTVDWITVQNVSDMLLPPVTDLRGTGWRDLNTAFLEIFAITGEKHESELFGGLWYSADEGYTWEELANTLEDGIGIMPRVTECSTTAVPLPTDRFIGSIARAGGEVPYLIVGFRAGVYPAGGSPEPSLYTCELPLSSWGLLDLECGAIATLDCEPVSGSEGIDVTDLEVDVLDATLVYVADGGDDPQDLDGDASIDDDEAKLCEDARGGAVYQLDLGSLALSELDLSADWDGHGLTGVSMEPEGDYLFAFGPPEHGDLLSPGIWRLEWTGGGADTWDRLLPPVSVTDQWDYAVVREGNNDYSGGNTRRTGR